MTKPKEGQAVKFEFEDLFSPAYEEDHVPTFRILINGLWLSSSSNKTFDVTSPVDGSVVARVQESAATDVDAAVDAAVGGHRKMRDTAGAERLDLFARAREIFVANRRTFLETLKVEAGKPPREAEGEVKATLDRMEMTAQESREIWGEFIPGEWSKDARGRVAIVTRVPLGVVAAIAPFNYPLFIAAAKVIPALLAGNGVVAKPASDAPLSLLLFARVLEDAGFPPGAVNVVTGKGGTVGEALVSNDSVAMVSFTGSTQAGERIVRQAGVKKLHLELGGKGMAIILDDADLDLAAGKCAEGALKNAGQRCDAISAILVMESLADRFVKRLDEEIATWKHGDPREEGVRVGPLINRRAAERVQELIDDAIKNGAKLVCGGKSHGCYVEPTLIDHIPIAARIAFEETFGPVAAVVRIEDEKEALEISRMSRYGLDSCIFTKDYRRVWRIAKDLRVGEITVNDYPRHGVGYFPFGGSKASGIGREGIGFSVDEMTELKTIVFNLED